MNNIGISLDDDYVAPSEYQFDTIYRAVPSNTLGFDAGGSLVSGCTLKVAMRGYGYDPLAEWLSNTGHEDTLDFLAPPKEGVKPWCYYIVTERCTSFDWETGYCDDTEIELVKYMDASI